MAHCSLSQDVWENGDFSPCFRAIVIDSLIPTVVLAWAIGAITRSAIEYRRSSSPAYSPLIKDTLPVSYGTARDDDNEEEEEENISAASSRAPSTIASTFEPKSARWTIFNFTRLLGTLLHFGLACATFRHLSDQKYKLDERVEGSWMNVRISVGTNVLFWGALFLLSFLNLSFAGSSKKAICPRIIKQLNVLLVCDFLINCFDLRSFYLVHYTTIGSTGYSLSIASACITLPMLAVLMHEGSEPEDPVVITDTGRPLSRERWASLYSRYMFSWMEDTMRKGFKNTLNEDDLDELLAENRAKHILREYKKHRSHSVAWGIVKSFKKELAAQFLFSMVWSVCMLGPPIFLNKIVNYIEAVDQTEPVSTAYLYVVALLVTASAETLASQQALYIGRTLCIRIQAIVVGEVFDKALRRRAVNLSEDEEQESKAKANVNNLLSVDSQKISDFSSYVFFIYSYPVQLIGSIICLYQLLGVAALWGVLVMVLAQPVTVYLNKQFERVQDKVMTATDKRLKVVNELLQAIRIVKFFAWEDELHSRTLKARTAELKVLRERLMLFMHSSNAWFFIPIMIMVVVFYVYTRTNELTAATAFSALALFNILRMSLDELPMMFVWALQARVSVKRIEDFLDQDDVEIKGSQMILDGVKIGFVGGATFGWEKDESKAIIKNLNLSFPQNKLSIVCGPTGSGKTTLLSSLLGETYCFQGESRLPRTLPNRRSPLGGAVSGIAYVAQTAWLQNCSIKDNILFGLPYDEDRYEKVLYATALTKDLDVFEYGDSTEVGEKGVTLSGGQKQRLALARAVYSQAATVILDDCLSAVDAHTAKHLYEHCITGDLMRGRTVILVTHHVGLCIKDASYVVALKDGQVVSCGDPQMVIQSGALGDELNRKSEEADDAAEEAAVDGAVPLVPKTVKKKLEDGAGKLIKEEARAEGSVTWAVYKTYFHASGGYLFWFIIIFMFGATQLATLGQDYWIKVWASAYRDYSSDTQVITSDAVSSLGSFRLQEPPLGNLLVPQSGKQEVNIVYYLGIYIIIGVVALIMSTGKYIALVHASMVASYQLHEKLLHSILRAKVRFFDTTPLGRVINRFSSDIGTIDQELTMSLGTFLYSVVSTLCVVLLISAVMPLFIMPAVVIAALYWMIGAYYIATSRDMKRLNSVSRSPIYIQFEESLNGVATIRAFGANQRFLRENFKRIDDNNRPFLWMWATNRWLHIRVELLGSFVSFCTGLVVVISRNTVDPGLAGLCLSYALTFTAHVLWIVRMYAQLEMEMNSIERVHEYLNIEEEAPARIPENEPPASWPETGSVKVEDLVMRYSPDSPAVLHNVSFETRPFEKVGIVGRTGSGKSTLTLSIFRFMEPSNGRILIDGVDIGTLGLGDLRSRLTIIPQDPVLFSGTLRNNLDPFNQHDEAELWAALKRSHLIDDKNGESEKKITLDSPVLEGGSNWSQGQRQLIALARALVKRSTLIILDEATSSVDFDTDHKIQQTIRKEFNRSSLLCIAHRIRTVVDYDRILVLDQGRVKEFDTPYNLITRKGGIFNEMCERSGEYSDLLQVATAKHLESK
ncbi:P-loop containing nucleoside triphosphate hydrolase protein [Dichotomocladium elegans]|nr:P-loop containing nucleoside triphosphate hydrolase protein [Dichotomocladium elegans]